MTWLLPRFLSIALSIAAGSAMGLVVERSHSVVVGALVGGVFVVAMLVVRDTLRGYRLIKWLRGSLEGSAPRAAGLWGELGYRIERAVKLHKQEVQLERTRLTQFLSAIEASPNGVMLLDGGDQIEWCNSLAADHFGLDPLRDRHQRVTNLVRAPAFVSHLQAGAFTNAVQMTDPGGQGALSVLVRSYGDGLKIVLSQDITERERSESMRRHFVANVSHEIRTPLTVLMGFIETMVNLPLTEVERKRVLVLMTQQAQRMGTLVSDLLTLAQLEGSPRPNPDRWVALGPLLEQVETDTKLLSAGRHTLVFADPGNAHIAGAQNELLSAITNLTTNAVRYTPDGGRIDVTWKVLGDGSGEIAVNDTGLGIAREHLPRLTERFYRVDGSRSRDTGGTGLGLSIVKHVVQRHGGELDIQSEPGKGSQFRLVFPSVRVRSSDGSVAKKVALTAASRTAPAQY